MKAANKTDPVSIRLDPETKAGLEALAKADERAFASYAALVLKRHMEAKLRKPKSEKP